MMNSRQVWPDIWNLVLHRFHQEQNQPKMSERESEDIFKDEQKNGRRRGSRIGDRQIPGLSFLNQKLKEDSTVVIN